MGDGIYVSYRRGDAAGYPLLIAERLRREFGADKVFLDTLSLQPGANWAASLSDAVLSCRSLVAVIGPGWLGATDGSGVRRIDNPDDFVRREIEAALNGGLRVIPVLVDGAIMPRSNSLPPPLVGLARRQAAVILGVDGFQLGLERLIEGLRLDVRAREPKPDFGDALRQLFGVGAKESAFNRPPEAGAVPPYFPPPIRDGAAPPEAPTLEGQRRRFYVSYAWADSSNPDRDRDVDRLCEEAGKRGVVIRRDKNDLKIGDRISTFMEQIGQGDLVFVFLSDKYLRSPFCMSELSSLWRNNKQSTTEFLSHVRMFNVDGVNIRESTDRLVYTQHWVSQRDNLRKTINVIGWEEVGESPIAEFFRMKTIAGEVADIVAIFADIVQAQTFDDLIRASFPAAPPGPEA